MFQKYQAIALLPANMIETAVKSILQESLSKFKEFATFRDLAKEASKLDNVSFAPFVDYFHKEWIKTVKKRPNIFVFTRAANVQLEMPNRATEN